MTSPPPASRRLYKEGNFNQKFSLVFLTARLKAVQQASWAARIRSSQRTSLQLGVWAFTSPAFSCWLPGPRENPGRLGNGWVSGWELMYVAKIFEDQFLMKNSKFSKLVEKSPNVSENTLVHDENEFRSPGSIIGWKEEKMSTFGPFCAIFIFQF